MKKITLIVSMITLCIGFSSTASAQVTASAPTNATVVAPIAITNTTDMSFGNLAVSTALGTVVMDPVVGVATRAATGGVTLPATTGTVTAAQFTVTGEGAYTYAITLPTTLDLTDALSSTTMTVNGFTSTPTVAAGGALTAGTQDLYVGATLNVGASQAAGLYENTTGFDVTVNYN